MRSPSSRALPCRKDTELEKRYLNCEALLTAGLVNTTSWEGGVGLGGANGSSPTVRKGLGRQPDRWEGLLPLPDGRASAHGL